MTNTIYLFLPTDKYSIQLLEKVLILLIGGYDLHCHCLQPIVMSPVDDTCSDAMHSFDIMLEKVRQYNKIYTCLNEFKTCMCQTEIALPLYLKYTGSSSNHIYRSIFGSNGHAPNYIESLLCLKNQYNVDCTSDNKIVFATALSEDFRECIYIQSIISCFVQCPNPNITIICDLTSISQKNINIPEHIKKSLKSIKEKSKLVVTGLGDSSKITFTRLQTACSILDSINNSIEGESLVKGKKNGLCYTQDNLPSNSASMALVRLGLLEKLRTEGVDNIANKWMSNLRVKDPWNDVPALASINYFLPALNEWMNGISNTEFSLEITDGIFKHLIQSLNGVASLPITSSLERRRRETMTSVLTALEEAVKNLNKNGDTIGYKPIPNSFYITESWNFELGHLNNEFSPTCLFEITDLAFSSEFMHENKALIWRSTCLDLWELFILNDITILNSIVEVKEKRFSEDFNSNEQKLLSLSNVGQFFIDADIYYQITNLEHSFTAYTSPLTGFCVSEYRKNPITIKNHRYFSLDTDEMHDLKDRNMEIQQFIYSYVNMRDNMFSSNFKEYIDKQIERNKASIQSHGVDVIRMYSQLRKHIGIDFENETT